MRQGPPGSRIGYRAIVYFFRLAGYGPPVGVWTRPITERLWSTGPSPGCRPFPGKRGGRTCGRDRLCRWPGIVRRYLASPQTGIYFGWLVLWSIGFFRGYTGGA